MSRGQMCVSGKLHVHGRACQLGKAAVDSFFATLLYEVFVWVRRRKLRGTGCLFHVSPVPLNAKVDYIEWLGQGLSSGSPLTPQSGNVGFPK